MIEGDLLADLSTRTLVLIGLCAGFTFLGMWVGWEMWGKPLKYAKQDGELLSLGYMAALRRVVEALALWEQTRYGWEDDGTQRIPLNTSMRMADALGFGRTTLLADSEPPNVRAKPDTTAEIHDEH